VNGPAKAYQETFTPMFPGSNQSDAAATHEDSAKGVAKDTASAVGYAIAEPAAGFVGAVGGAFVGVFKGIPQGGKDAYHQALEDGNSKPLAVLKAMGGALVTGPLWGAMDGIEAGAKAGVDMVHHVPTPGAKAGVDSAEKK